MTHMVKKIGKINMKKILAKEEIDFFNLFIKVNQNDDGELYEEIEDLKIKFQDTEKPTSYPVIIVYHHYSYIFLYEYEFKNFVPFDSKQKRNSTKTYDVSDLMDKWKQED